MRKKTTIKPRGKQVLVKQDPKGSNVSPGGLIIPDNVEQEQKAIGTVIAIGSLVDDIAVGDRVIFAVFGGDAIKIKEDGKEVEYRILFDEYILAFINE